jgi:hypothetical protein
MVARFGLGYENYEAFDSGDSVAATADFFNVKLVLLTFLNWLVEGTFRAHAFHLVQFVQLVRREKTQTSTRLVTQDVRFNPHT